MSCSSKDADISVHSSNFERTLDLEGRLPIHPGNAAVEEPPPKPSKPHPQLASIIRNTHEVLRGGLRDLEIALHDESIEIEERQQIWKEFFRWVLIHQTMEEGGGRAKGLFG